MIRIAPQLGEPRQEASLPSPSPSRGLFVPHYVGGELRFPATTHLYKVKARLLVVTDYHPLKTAIDFLL